MRLDKFLKVSRVIKRRTVAASAADAGRVTVNGRLSKPGHQIKEGDVIEVAFGESVLKFRVLRVSETVKKEEADSMYEIINE